MIWGRSLRRLQLVETGLLRQVNARSSPKLHNLKLHDGRVEVADVAFLEAGSGLAKMGVPLDEILDQSEVVQDLIVKVTTQFEGVFAKYFWDEFESAGYPENKIDQVLEQVEQLSKLAHTVVTASLRQEFQKLADTYSEKARK